ncbi:aminoglycoside phosphotransferase family protein [Mycobacterium sp. DSM 3803]|nr:aminoglycoside phosphotransferase family protein [Mycobacterium sp. DSM 3803]
MDLDLVAAASRQFGLRGDIFIEAVKEPTLHRVFKCSDGYTALALKYLTPRPDLPGWLDKFLFTFDIEVELSKDFDFLPVPQTTESGEIFGSPDGYHNFIAHLWRDGRTALENDLVQVDSQLGEVIGAIRQLSTCRLRTRTNADDPVPGINEVIAHVREAVSSELDVVHTLNKARPFLQEILCATAPRPNIVGHRDLTPRNVLIGNGGRISVVDWENAGLTHITQEVGRILATWNIDPQDLGTSIQRLLGTETNDYSSLPKCFWFREWLEGHLMFMEYLWRQGTRTRFSYKLQVDRLCGFVRTFQAFTS